MNPICSIELTVSFEPRNRPMKLRIIIPIDFIFLFLEGSTISSSIVSSSAF